jgi:cell division protease FtsH
VAEPADQRQSSPAGADDKPPWRVDPAPDGRGAPPEKGSPTGMSWRRFGAVLLALLVLNYFLTSLLPGGERPERISYTPVFLSVVTSGNV